MEKTIHFTLKASHFSINSSTEIAKRSVPPSWTPQTHFAIPLPNPWISNQAQKLPSKTTTCHFDTKLNPAYRHSTSLWLLCTEPVPVEYYVIRLLHPTFVMRYVDELLLLNGSMKSRVPPKTRAVPIQCCTVNGLPKSNIDDIKLINFRMVMTSVTVSVEQLAVKKVESRAKITCAK
ncbi:hypothetical protein T01_8126 [Trichinella spiralis]|uniref:Uncharacterized protein n=1 Tax=Trichinella spiralis TaxID=6334 RepID=A0A0V1B3L1_TRISP|nr:hypothetical protein T01_8126 [Trichinella spiralis]